mgnify:CR=1 FL=1
MDIFPLLSLYLRMNNVLSTVERNMVEGEAWPCLYFLNFHEINELMTFPKFLVKSCYWNSFLLSFQDNLLLFTFFYHYINMGVFNHLIMSHHCLCSMDKRGGLQNWKWYWWSPKGGHRLRDEKEWLISGEGFRNRPFRVETKIILLSTSSPAPSITRSAIFQHLQAILWQISSRRTTNRGRF